MFLIAPFVLCFSFQVFVKFVNSSVMFPALNVSDSSSGKGIVTRTTTAETNNSTASVNHTSRRRIKDRFSFDVILFPWIPSCCLATLKRSLPEGSSSRRSCWWSLFMSLSGVVLRLSREDER